MTKKTRKVVPVDEGSSVATASDKAAPRTALLRQLDAVTQSLDDCLQYGKLKPTGLLHNMQMRHVDGYETTPVHMAAKLGDASLLRQHMHDPSCRQLLSKRDERGWFPIHYAACAGRCVRFDVAMRSPELEDFERSAVLKELCDLIMCLDPDADVAADSDVDDADSQAITSASTVAAHRIRARLEGAAGSSIDSAEGSEKRRPLWVNMEDEEGSSEDGIWLDARVRWISPSVTNEAALTKPTLTAMNSSVSVSSPPRGVRKSVSMSSVSSAGGAGVSPQYEPFPALEIELIQLRDCEAQRGTAQRQSRAAGRIIPRVSLEKASFALEYILSNPPSVCGGVENTAQLWKGQMASLASEPRLFLYDIALSAQSRRDLGKHATSLQMQLVIQGNPVGDAVLRQVPMQPSAPPLQVELVLPMGTCLPEARLRLSLWSANQVEVASTDIDMSLLNVAAAAHPELQLSPVGSALADLLGSTGGGGTRGVSFRLSYELFVEGQRPQPSHDRREGTPSRPIQSTVQIAVSEGNLHATFLDVASTVSPEATGDTSAIVSAWPAPWRMQKPRICDGPQCVSVLLMAGCEPDALDLTQATALHKASAHGDIASITVLLRCGGELETANMFGDRCLHRAAENGRMLTGRVLIKKGCDVDAPNQRGDSSLHVACQTGNGGFVNLLLGAGATLARTNALGYTPIHTTVVGGHQCILSTLVAHCKARKISVVEMVTKPLKDTVLHLAVRALHMDLLKWMLGHKFAPALLHANEDGLTPLALLEMLLPKVAKLAKAGGAGKGEKVSKGSKGSRGTTGEKGGKKAEKGGKKGGKKGKKATKAGLLPGLTPETVVKRLGAESTKRIDEIMKTMQKEGKVAAADAAAKAKKEAEKKKQQAKAAAGAKKAALARPSEYTASAT